MSDTQDLKLNLASGHSRMEGFLNVDIASLPEVDRVVDLQKFPWPFEADSVAEIVCSHYIEHTPDMIAFMDECWRILKPKGVLRIIAPYYTSARCWQDPTHLRAISERSFLYYNRKWRADNRLDHYPIKSDFDFEYGYAVTPDWASRSEEARAFAIRHYWNVVDDIHVTLRKRE